MAIEKKEDTPIRERKRRYEERHKEENEHHWKMKRIGIMPLRFVFPKNRRENDKRGREIAERIAVSDGIDGSEEIICRR